MPRYTITLREDRRDGEEYVAVIEARNLKAAIRKAKIEAELLGYWNPVAQTCTIEEE